MKRLCGVLAIIMLFVTSGFTVMAEQEISVILDGEYLTFDVPPQIINGRTMLPARAIIEAIGAEVQWDEETQTVTATKEDKSVSFVINQYVMRVDDAVVPIDVPACIVEDRTLVPVRALTTAFVMQVDWDEETRTVSLQSFEAWLDELSKLPEPVVDSEAFDVLKNKIIAEGTYLDGYYSIDFAPEKVEIDYASMALMYYPDSDDISWYIYTIEDGMIADAFFSIYNTTESPSSVLITISANGEKADMYGNFYAQPQGFAILKNDMSEYGEAVAYNLMEISIDAFDKTMESLDMDIKMANFGIIMPETETADTQI